MQGSEGKLSVVLFHKAARVQALDIPKGTEISAQLIHDAEDGPEIDYRVFEEVPPEVPSPPSETHHVPFLSEPLRASDLEPLTDAHRRSGWTSPASE